MTFLSGISVSLDISTINKLFFVQSFASTCAQRPGNEYWNSTSSNVLNESWSTVQTAENQYKAQRSNVQRMCSPSQNDGCKMLNLVDLTFIKVSIFKPNFKTLKMHASKLSTDHINGAFYCLIRNATVYISRAHHMKCLGAPSSTHVQEERACALGCYSSWSHVV